MAAGRTHNLELVVADDPTEEAAQRIAAAARAGGHVALSGGSTPRPAYERAAILAADWSRVELWFVDERIVPPDDPRSNYRLIRESLLDALARPPAAVHRVRGELPPEEAAAAYDGELEGVTLAFALMGIGSDGHTASFFPNAPALEEQERRAVAADAGLDPFVPRVTLTRPVLDATEEMVFLVTGAEKADAVARAFAGEPSPETPASLVRGKRTTAILDSAAASKLTEQG
jgi:6-phosphogluconolactonase